MDLRTDIEPQLRGQRLKAALLQSHWQEVRERQHRAQLHNQKLLQDFQRAQETLCDLVAQTEAMNTIRVEYESYLQENFPRWVQKLKDKRLLEQRKRIEEHLKACFQREEDQSLGSGNKSSKRTSSPSSVSPVPSQPPSSHPISHTSEHRDKNREVYARMLRSTLAQENKQNSKETIQQDIKPFYVPFTWLTQSHPSVSEPQQSHISTQTRTSQNIHQASKSSFLFSGEPLHDAYPLVMNEPQSNDHVKEYPKGWTRGVQCDPAAPWTSLPVVNPLVWKMMEMSGIDAHAQGMYWNEEEEKQMKKSSSPPSEKHQAQKQSRKMKGSDQSSDTMLARLSNNHTDSSDSSALSCEAATSFPFGMQKRSREKRGNKQTHQPIEKGFFSMADSHPDRYNEKERGNQNPTVRKVFKNQVSSANMMSKYGLESPKNLKEQSEGYRIQETLKCSSTAAEKKNVFNKKDETPKKNHEDQKKRPRRKGEDTVSTVGEKEETTDLTYSGQNEEEKSNESNGKMSERGFGNEETEGGMKDKSLRRIVCEGGFLLEELGNYVVGSDEEETDGGEEEEDDRDKEEEKQEDAGEGEEKDRGKEKGMQGEGRGEEQEDGEEEMHEDGGREELEEGEEEQQDDKGEDDNETGGEEAEEEEAEREEKSDEISVAEAPRTRSKEDDDESDDKENDSEAAASDSVRNIHDSLQELYIDTGTEDEELYEQEIEDDIEDDDDDVVVKKAHHWSYAYNHAKYQDYDDDDDDVEGLLAPQNNVEQHQADEEEKTVQPKDLHSDSEEEGLQKKTLSAPVQDDPVNSDDEFDHFYD